MVNPKFQARFPEPLAERVNAWADERGLKNTEALRRLAEQGLDAEQDPSRRQAIASKVSLALAVAGLAVAPLGIAYPNLFLVAIVYVVIAAATEAYAQGAIGGPSIPGPWGRSA